MQLRKILKLKDNLILQDSIVGLAILQASQIVQHPELVSLKRQTERG